jgi:subtilisin family serine protease
LKNSFIFIILLGFIISTPSVVYGEHEVASETDRVIVKTTDSDGEEKIESVTWETLEGIEEVDVLEPDYIRSVGSLTVSGNITSWATERVGIKEMTDQFSLKEENVIVAVIDTGIDYTHSFLKDRIVNGYDFVENDTDPMDMHYHGTHVSGIITESTTENVKIMPIRALDENGNGYDSNIAKGIHYAVDHGASVINMSFEGKNYSSYLSGAIDYALSNDVLIVVASGNESADTANYYPASEQKVIVVSATDQYNNVAYFSNIGSSIDIAAPGVGIISTIPGERYGILDGTSMATPFVSGVAAMLELDYPNRTISEIEELLKGYVNDTGPVGWDPLFGEGIVNVSSFEKYSRIREALNSTNYTALPEYKDVVLNKKWTITFNRSFTDSSIISVKLYSDDMEIPISITNNLFDKQLIVVPNINYKTNTAYQLEITVEKGKRYLMNFTTTY